VKIAVFVPGIGRVAVAVLACLGGAASAAPSLNLQQATADTKAILAAGDQADIVLFGDSLAFGDSSFRPGLTVKLQSLYGDAGLGFSSLGPERVRFGAGWSAGVLNASDPAPHHGLDGLWLKALPGSGPLPSDGVITAFWDRMELHYVAEPGGGTLQLAEAYGGRPIARIDTNSPVREVRTFTYHFPPTASSSVRFQPDGTGPVTLLGMNLPNDNPGVRVHRASNGGWGVNNFLQRDWTFDEELRLLDTDMVMIAVGANDTPLPHEEFVQKLGQFVERIGAAVPDAEIVLVAPYDFGKPGVENVVGGIEEVAAARQLGLINLYETAGDYQFFLDSGYLNDGLHFTPEGGAYVGNILAEAFRTNGANFTGSASAVPEPGFALPALAAGLLALRRRTR
jgi:lysophospholipase L1-like esterase